MAAAGLAAIWDYAQLHNRPLAPEPFMEGEEPEKPERMTIHIGMH